MHFELSSKKQQSLMSHECPPAVRSKLRDQRVRIWSVGEAVRI